MMKVRDNTQALPNCPKERVEAAEKRFSAERQDNTDAIEETHGIKNRLFRTLIDQSTDVFEVLDPNTGRFLDVNESGCLQLGYTREEYLDLYVFDIDPTVTPEVFEASSKELRNPSSMSWEGIHRRKDGSTFPVEVSLRYVQLERDYIIAISRDISERKKLEETIRQGQDTQAAIASILRLAMTNLPLDDLLRKVLEIVLNIPWLAVERSGAILLREQESGLLVMRAEVGLAEALKRRCAKVPFGVCLCGRAAASGEVFFKNCLDSQHENSYEGIQPHGHYCVPIAFAGTVQGVMTTYVAAGHARSKREEDFLTAVADTLAGIIARRKEEEKNRQISEQLRHTQRLEAVGRLAGGVAHDFNNLLTVILSYTDFALEGLQDRGPLLADLKEVREATLRGATLTRQLLAFSRRQVLEPVVVDMDQIVLGLEGMLRRLLGEDINIEVRLDAKDGRIEADPGQIEQVLMNLVINARDAMPAGGNIIIETACVEFDEEYASQHDLVKPGRFVQLAVTDTGHGMDLETRQRIFEPFFTTKEKGKGTGLGLSTVYGIVKQSDGSIRVYSEPGRGTTFKVHLPRVDKPTARSRPSELADTTVKGETILIVEDEGPVRELAGRILKKAGYSVLSATTATHATLLRDRHKDEIDLLLTDVVMPGMDGQQLADRLRIKSPALKILYMSGYTDNAIVHNGVLDPGVHFIAKPFTAADLTQKVREVLDCGDECTT